MRIPRLTLMHIWFRLLFLQCSWNFERIQGLGFLYALLPGLKKIYPAEALVAAGRRHLGYFNTHPYLAPLVAGAVLQLEKTQADSGAEQIDIGDFKEMVAAPYAAIGDALFWGGLRPLAAGVSLFIAAKGIVWAPLVFLLLYNFVPTWFRVLGFVRGYREGMHSVQFVQRRKLPDWAIHTKEAAIVVLGGLSAFLVFTHLQQEELASWLGLFTLLPMILLGLIARKGVSTLVLTLLCAIIIMLVSLFWSDMAKLLAG